MKLKYKNKGVTTTPSLDTKWHTINIPGSELSVRVDTDDYCGPCETDMKALVDAIAAHMVPWIEANPDRE